MTYKAIMNIGEYQEGEIVPDEQALLWLTAYKTPPVVLVGDATLPEPASLPSVLVSSQEEEEKPKHKRR